MAKKLGSAFQLITGGVERGRATGENNPVGVLLSADQKSRLDAIAAEMGTSRHKLMIYAIADFIRRYDAGEKPKTRQEIKTILDS